MSNADKPKPDNDEVLFLRCASCGIKEGGDSNIKLRTCNGCKLVKYCGVECQRKHRSRHKEACKRRAAELRDELLFQQPECTHLGDCPICFVPIPYEKDEQDNLSSAVHNLCCCKLICFGCIYESKIQGVGQKCPFCRTPIPENAAEAQNLVVKLFERENGVSFRQLADTCMNEGNHSEAFKYRLQAAKGGDMEAHQLLGGMFFLGEGVEKDLNKAIWHYEQAAIGGHPDARVDLVQKVLEHLNKGYKNGSVSKEALERVYVGTKKL